MVVNLLSLPLLLAQLPLLPGGMLGFMRPQVEAQMTRECQKAMGKAEGSFAALEGMCADLARPASVCVVQEIERNGNVMQVAANCLTRLMQTARPSWDQQFPVR